MKASLQTVVLVGLFASLSACAEGVAQQGADDPDFDPAAASDAALTDPHPAGAHDAHHALPTLPGGVDLEGAFLGTDGAETGTVMIAETPNGLLVRVDVRGVEHGFHGVHLHETGLCEPAEGFKTAGGHANPDGSEHGFFVPGGPHVGDLPNAYAHQEGHIRTDLFKADARLADVADADGFAVMVHSGADDYESQPSGAAGSRVACAPFPG